MKELSIEQKAKRYDKLIAKLIKAKEDDDFNDERYCCVIDEIVPELKESEDERTRKDVLAFIRREGQHIDKYKWHKWIAWLEKQESYYTFEIKEGHWYKCVCDYMLNSSDLMFKNDRLYYCRSNWRLRGEIDERNVKDIGVHGYKSFFRPATNQEIKDWLEKKGERKPAWNKEDEQHIDSLLKRLDGLCRNEFERTRFAINEDKDWLKSLKDRVGCEANCTTTKEWSEEDENVLNNLIAFLKVEDELQYDWKQIIAWLKSLKQRIGG